MTWIYLDMEQVSACHQLTLEKSGGGMSGHYDLGRLESVLQNIQNDDYYPSIEEKLTHLFYSACKFHCFADGNKRTAIVLTVQMLSLNGYLRSLKYFMNESENISYFVAAGSISKELLLEWITAMLNGEEDDESLKLKIVKAIS
jgi:death-on-curing protein